MTTETQQQPSNGPCWVDLDGAHNVRDLGGLPAATGRTRHATLYRSDSLDRLTPSDVHTLSHQLEVRTVIDLRGPRELPAVAPNWWNDGDVRRVAIPLLDEAALDAARRTQRWTTSALSTLYQTMLATSGPSLVAILGIAASPGATPVLLHCAAGKDRTGVATAVLLAAAGVHPDAIVADYLATNQRMSRVFTALTETGYAVPPEAAQSPDLLKTPASVILSVIRQLDSWPRGAEGYLLAQGADPQDLQRWRARLIDGASP